MKGIRRPERSATAPKSGERTAIRMPAAPMPYPQIACAVEPSPTTDTT